MTTLDDIYNCENFGGWGLYLHTPLLLNHCSRMHVMIIGLSFHLKLKERMGQKEEVMFRCLEQLKLIQKYNGSIVISNLVFQSYPHYRMHYDSSLS